MALEAQVALKAAQQRMTEVPAAIEGLSRRMQALEETGSGGGGGGGAASSQVAGAGSAAMSSPPSSSQQYLPYLLSPQAPTLAHGAAAPHALYFSPGSQASPSAWSSYPVAAGYPSYAPRTNIASPSTPGATAPLAGSLGAGGGYGNGVPQMPPSQQPAPSASFSIMYRAPTSVFSPSLPKP
jgi:hypothetical protein